MALTALIDELSPERAASAIGKQMRHAGMAFAMNVPKILGVEVRDLETKAEIAAFGEAITGIESMRLASEPGTILKEYTKCPYIGQSPIMCLVHEVLQSAICETLDPGLTANILSSVNRGEGRCRILISRK